MDSMLVTVDDITVVKEPHQMKSQAASAPSKPRCRPAPISNIALAALTILSASPGASEISPQFGQTAAGMPVSRTRKPSRSNSRDIVLNSMRVPQSVQQIVFGCFIVSSSGAVLD